MEKENIKKEVRKRYAKIAKTNGSCCASNVSCCSAPTHEQVSKTIGYSQKELDAVPEGANLGLGCGNPTALALLKEGGVVIVVIYPGHQEGLKEKQALLEFASKLSQNIYNVFYIDLINQVNNPPVLLGIESSGK